MNMDTIKKILLLLLVWSVSFALTAQETLREAETAYAQEDYAKAIELYESVLKTYGDSYEVYYNLGNACYKAGKIAAAILNYERALLIRPGDRDIRHNLEIAGTRTVDHIEPLGDLLLSQWFRAVQHLFAVDTWATIGLITFILFAGCLALFFFDKRMFLRKTGFYTGIALFIIVLFANIFAWNERKALTERNGAIVFAPTVTVKSTPDAGGLDLFVLHEGTKVFIRSVIGEWNEIELEDGSIGWIHRKDIEKI
ncbi:MAG: tetratricopeptide repeat protein [Tannerella sp.]|jgi:tetratricopeptide (TPR) repeat protein|nr:tetratricopeptide repeat protein [Tannerella sp.]